MGGIGSGRRRGATASRRRIRQTTDQLPALDVRSLKREGLIVPGQEHVNVLVRFRRRRKEHDDDDVEVVRPGPEHVELVARLRLTWTACNYGGAGRPWFVCPGCERRAAILYGTAPPLLCRSCLGLVYASQRRL